MISAMYICTLATLCILACICHAIYRLTDAVANWKIDKITIHVSDLETEDDDVFDFADG